MLALCSMLLGTYYAQNYASIIGGSLSLSDILMLSSKFYGWIELTEYVVSENTDGTL